MNKQITIADLNEELIDTLNGMNALITALVQRAGIPEQDVKVISFQASAGYQRAKAKMEQEKANRESYKEDLEAMAAWALDAHYMFADAKEWAKAADIEWMVIVDRNGSEHGRAHTLRYKEPTQAELLKALDAYGKWVNSTNPQYAGHRARAQKVLPHIKKKLAALLVA